MAIPFFCESFQAADSAQYRTRYDFYADGGSSLNGIQNDGGGARSGRSYNIGFFGLTSYSAKSIAAGETSILIGARFRTDSASTRTLLSLRNVANSATHLTLMMNSSNQIELRRGDSGGTLLATSTTTFSAGTGFSVQLKATINSSTGSYELRLNGLGTAEFSGSGANTQTGASADITAAVMGGFSGTFANVRIQDFWFMDGSNSFPGDVFVDYKVVNGAGTYQDFTPSTGTDHDALLDEIPPNTSDYVSSSTSGHKETNTVTALSGSSLTIIGVQAVNYMFKDNPGLVAARNLIRSGSTNSAGSTVYPSTTAGYFVTPYAVDPNTGSAWTSSAVNAAEVGVEIV